MKFKISIALVIVSLGLLIWASLSLVKDHQSANDPQLLTTIGNMQKLLLYSKPVSATYEKSTSVVHSVGEKYSYTVNGKTYSHQITIPNPPPGDKFIVAYLPNNPNIQSPDPGSDVIRANRELASRKEPDPVKWGLLVVGLLGLMVGVRRVFAARKPAMIG